MLVLAGRHGDRHWLAHSRRVPIGFGISLRGTEWNKRAFCWLVFCSGGLLFSPDRVKGMSGPCPYIFSLPRCPATFSPRFWRFAVELFTRLTLRPLGIFDLSPLQDQEFAGALMWVSVTLIYLIPAVIITVQILSPGVPAEAKAVQS